MNAQAKSSAGKARTAKASTAGKATMRTVSAAEANRQFSALLREVQEGGTVTITSRGLPVALLKPFDAVRAKAEAAEREKRFQAMLEEWRSRPAMHLGKFNRDDAYD